MTVMAKVITSAEICENAKMARDMALAGEWTLIGLLRWWHQIVNLVDMFCVIVVLLAGNYDSASIYYEALIPSLQRFTINISDPMRKGKWTMVRIHTIYFDFLAFLFIFYVLIDFSGSTTD